MNSPRKPTGGEFDAATKWPPGGAKLIDADGAGQDATKERTTGAVSGVRGAREPCGTRTAGVRATGPRKTAGGRGCSVSGGGFQAGGPEGRRHSKRKWPPCGCPQRGSASDRTGMGLPPRAMIRNEKGAPPKGGPGGKTQAGETAAPRLPAAPR